MVDRSGGFQIVDIVSRQTSYYSRLIPATRQLTIHSICNCKAMQISASGRRNSLIKSVTTHPIPMRLPASVELPVLRFQLTFEQAGNAVFGQVNLAGTDVECAGNCRHRHFLKDIQVKDLELFG